MGSRTIFLGFMPSHYDFIGENLQTEEGSSYLKTPTISNIAWKQDTRDMDERQASNFEFYNLDTICGAVMKTGT